MIEKYYEEELRYLHESGREFAKAHPDRARFLNMDTVGDRDPYVERLLEGFAFLAGRIREKLDDTFPQLTEGTINLLWPGLLREIPSAAMVQFTPRPGLLHGAVALPRGSEVLCGPVGPESAICRFITSQKVVVNPVALSSARRGTDSHGRETLDLTFRLDPGAEWGRCDLDPIRLHLHADLPTALMLHHALTAGVIAAHVSVGPASCRTDMDPATAATPGGFSTEEMLLPEDDSSFPGYALLREYFVYPEKFLFVDLHGLGSVYLPDHSPTEFTFTYTFESPLPADKPFAADTFRLSCSPAVNIFRREAEPVVRTGKKSEYRMIADASHPRSVKLHSAISVTGIDRVTGERSNYQQLYTFRNISHSGIRTFATRYSGTPGGQREPVLLVGGPQLSGGTLTEENLSITAWCTNGELPRDTVRVGDIQRPGRGFPEHVRITNITRPTLPCAPPDRGEYLWMFQSHLASTWASLASAETLKSVLRVYDWSGQEGRSRRIKAIEHVRSEPCEEVVGGAIMRGVQVTVTLAEKEFRDSGDVHLFGLVLMRFLQQYVSINSYVGLVFVLKPSGRTMTWKPSGGARCLI